MFHHEAPSGLTSKVTEATGGTVGRGCPMFRTVRSPLIHLVGVLSSPLAA